MHRKEWMVGPGCILLTELLLQVLVHTLSIFLADAEDLGMQTGSQKANAKRFWRLFDLICIRSPWPITSSSSASVHSLGQDSELPCPLADGAFLVARLRQSVPDADTTRLDASWFPRCNLLSLIFHQSAGPISPSLCLLPYLFFLLLPFRAGHSSSPVLHGYCFRGGRTFWFCIYLKWNYEWWAFHTCKLSYDI